MAGQVLDSDRSEVEDELAALLDQIISSRSDSRKTSQDALVKRIRDPSNITSPPATMDQLPIRHNAIGFGPAPSDSDRRPNYTPTPAFGQDVQLRGEEGVDELAGGARPRGFTVESFTLPNGVRLQVSAATGLRGLQPQVKSALQAMLNAAPAAGITMLDVTAGAQGGHLSHRSGVDFDLKGFTADGALWSPSQRAMIAEGAMSAGADRFGLYSRPGAPVGNGTMHVGFSGPGRPASVWGRGGAVRGPESRPLTDPAERAFLARYVAQFPAAVPATEEATVAAIGGVSAPAQVATAGGAPDAATVPLPRISPYQRSLAQTQPPATESVAQASALPLVEETQSPARAATEAALNLEDEGPTRPSEALSVRVRRGDTLWGIAERYLGNGQRWTEIQAANGGVQPKSLVPGMVLQVPGAASPPTPALRPADMAIAGAEAGAQAVSGESARVVPDKVESAPAPVSAPPATPPPEPVPSAPSRRVPEDFERQEDAAMLSQFAQPYAMPAPAAKTPAAPVAPAVSEQVGSPEYSELIDEMDRRFGDVRWTPGGDAGKPRNVEPSAPSPAVVKKSSEPSWWEVGTGVLSDLLSDATAPANVPAPLELEDAPARSMRPAQPLVPSKDQSRIDPSWPSQKQPPARIAPPKDAVGGTEKPATGTRDFLPLTPDAFRAGKNPPGVTDVKIIPSGGAVNYRQSGYAVTSMSNGIATRMPIPTGSSSSGPTVVERWNPSTNSWVPSRPQGGAPITNQTQLTPVQQSNAGAALPGRPY